jgi:predicted enzyme related to lactoylglutathione lyase
MNGSVKTLLHTVIINTRQMEALAAFYQAGLELDPPQPTADNHLGFHLPNVYLGFDLVQDTPENYPGAVSLWFAVEDLEATFQRFVDLGARVRYGPTRKPWGGYLAAVFDPDGNVVGLTQED